uniref:Syntaxin binding protein 4 n=1 Tax=Bos mutus grunniens TaxID=30521 RepID=A0A8B9X8R4_BOSMU
MNKNTSSVVSSSLLEKDPAFQVITVTKKTGLGLKILGGINWNEGPLVYIQEIISGGDCYKDGCLKPGDQLVSVNKESMIGVSFEEAKSIITRAKLRSESFWETAFIRQKSDSSHLENPSCSSLLQATGEYGPRASKFNAILPSFRRNQIKTGYKKTEQIPVTSSDNSPTDMSNTDIAPAWTDNYGPQGKVSLNPSVCVKVGKLEMTLNYLGIQPTKEYHQALRQQVQVDPKGMVSFGDFVHVARNLFYLQLDEANVGAHEISSILNSQISQETGDSLETDEMEKFKHERNNTLEEVKTLKEKFLNRKVTSLGKNGHNIPATLALGSKELVKSVRAILDTDCLPYGWEEAYTAGGIEYFINHVTQITSWVHPVMSALNLSCSEETEEDCSREPPDQRN